MSISGTRNRFGSRTHDPFTTVNDEFNRQFKVGPTNPGPNLSCGLKTCRRCKQYKPMLGSTNKGNVFVCRDCNKLAKGVPNG